MEGFFFSAASFGLILFAIGLPVSLWERRQRERRELAEKNESARQGELPFSSEPRRAGTQ
ncbi:MAG: hypothetical protein NVSMB23_28960 [Myxococcales bacterium]